MSPTRSATPADEAAAAEDRMQYGWNQEELSQKYPDRPRNHARTLVFSHLFTDLFNPLNENKKQPAGAFGRKRGPPGQYKLSPHQQRGSIIERFITRWRKEVGNDFFPALRLILPDKDRDRGVYGLKENAIGKLLVRLMKIDKKSEDGSNLLNWKIPGQTTASRLAGDFAGRCFEVLSKRPMRTEVGDMTIAEVNAQLDRLAASTGEDENALVLETFYQRMNAEELMWLIRIILKQMKVGATERTFLNLWHPDGEALFSVSSSLMRVCWELYDPAVRLDRGDTSVSIMQCFQPQLAQFQMPASFQRMVEMTRPTEDDPEFWIEEKLDGERMQMHLQEDPGHLGGKKFCFWSRRAKDYTYLYGNGLLDENSSLTRHLKNAFDPGVRNLILDGEMITWDMNLDKIVPFGSLKTAALSEQQNQTNSDNAGHRPLFRVFDILYLNDKQLTQYTLRDRYKALEKAVKPVHRRLEVHAHTSATNADAIEPLLRVVVANASEGLVLKNPRSMYRLNSRNDDWLKVKPEYMSEFGESLDCVIIGGYYGSGHRGGRLSSFLCGLRASPNHVKAGANPEKCFSFFKVGGGFRGEDYNEIYRKTEGKWKEWDRKKPPSEYIELGGGESKQYERPDLWIRPKDSVVISVKAASVGPSDQFARGFSLRFPRFRQFRSDRAWDSALSIEEFEQLRQRADEEAHEKAMTIEDRKRLQPKRVKRELIIAGDDGGDASTAVEGTAKNMVFNGMEFCILSESGKPQKQSKAQIEAFIKANGGKVSQRPAPGTQMVLIADKKVVKVASLIKAGDVNIIRPNWIHESIEQSDGISPLPYEEKHLFHATDALRELSRQNTDQFGDSYARALPIEELKVILDGMPKEYAGDREFDKAHFLAELDEHNHCFSGIRGLMFMRCVICIRSAGDPGPQAAKLARVVRYGGGKFVSDDSGGEEVTHIVVEGRVPVRVSALGDELRREVSRRRKIPRLVTSDWVLDSWKEKTILDEDLYVVR